MFYALLHGKVDSYGYTFDTTLSDIDELNKAAIEGYADITKISCGVLPHIHNNYQLLSSGSAIGYGNGPVLVSKRKIYPDEIKDIKVALPGENTTAALLLDRTLGEPSQKSYHLFSDIADVVLSDEADAGVLIHEGRFTYQKLDLRLIADLGSEWDSKFSLPVPLGAIVARRDFSATQIEQFSSMIARSIEYGFAHPKECYPFIKSHAMELDESVIASHIETFVNDFSVDMGTLGKEAISTLVNIKL